MLHAVEIVSTSSRSILRRSVRLGCELTTNVHGPRREELVDLSPRGARVITGAKVERGEHVLIAFAPEGLGRRVETLARVAHVEREIFEKPAIGVEFVSLEPELGRDIATRLRGVPPPLPRKSAPHARPKSELVWLDMLVTWEEDLGDRVNTFEVADRMAALDDGDLVIETLAPFLTGGGGRYQWIH